MEILGRVLDVPGDFKIQRDGVVVTTFTVARLPDGSMEFTGVRETDAPATVPPPPLYKDAETVFYTDQGGLRARKAGVDRPVYVPGDFSGYDMDGCD